MDTSTRNTFSAACRVMPAVWSLLLLAACDNTSTQQALPPVQIEAGNIDLVAQTAIDAALELGRVIGPGLAVLRGGLTAEAVLDPMSAASRFSARLRAGHPLPAVNTGSRPGPGGGQVDYTWDDHDDSLAASTGDSYALTFSDYVDTGVTLTGGMTVDHFTLFGELENPDTNWRASARVGLVNLAATAGNTTRVLNGVVSVDFENRLTVLLLTVRQDGDVTMGDATLLPGNLNVANQFTDDTRYELGSGTVQHPAFAGSLAYTTITPFQGATFDTFPSSGALYIPGAGGARMLITAVDNTQLLIQTDLNGDGITDDTRNIPWGG